MILSSTTRKTKAFNPLVAGARVYYKSYSSLVYTMDTVEKNVKTMTHPLTKQHHGPIPSRHASPPPAMRQYPLHRIRLLLAASALLFLWLGPIAALADMQEYADPETGEIKSFDPNEQLELHVVNLSKHRADVYWDDGQYGISVVTVRPTAGRGGSTPRRVTNSSSPGTG